jgi:1,4-dihydroxy-6-naphthoate synthase
VTGVRRPDVLRAAYSPCPNDTFVFHAWAHGLVDGAPRLDVTLADIDRTNTWLEHGTHDLLKISYAAVPLAIASGYALLASGGAVGRGCGPLLLVRDEVGADPDVDAAWLAGRTVAVPSERSTAYLLFRLWAASRIPAPGPHIVVMPFEQIMPAVAAGEVDAGLVIHEARFTYPTYALLAMVDLGEWWESDTGLAIPLGAIVVKTDLDVTALTDAMRASYDHARSHPEASAAYVAEHAQEMASDVQRRHIELYVNDLTRDLGDEGRAAVRGFLDRAAAAGLVPAVGF